MGDGMTLNVGCTNYNIHDNGTVNIYNGKSDAKKNASFDDAEYADYEEIVPSKEVETAAEEPSPADDEEPARPLPECLATPEAMAVWERLLKAGMVDEQWQPVGLSLSEKVVMASLISQTLWQGKNKWKPFEELWKMKNMSSLYTPAISQHKSADLIERINKALKK